ncbi:MAG: hypothetical protein GY943_08375 [Chloroflexi bacterium]|nr:hypothetical protein [Chloroflexota bacterium]
MKKIPETLKWLTLLVLFLAACGGTATEPAVTESTAAQPQLIEFYADW